MDEAGEKRPGRTEEERPEEGSPAAPPPTEEEEEEEQDLREASRLEMRDCSS
jgi:hypothetical protein